MSILIDYLIKAQQAIGLQHNQYLNVLRDYIKRTSEEDIIAEIGQIEDYLLLRTLWECGLNNRLQRVAIERMNTLTERPR